MTEIKVQLKYVQYKEVFTAKRIGATFCSKECTRDFYRIRRIKKAGGVVAKR